MCSSVGSHYSGPMPPPPPPVNHCLSPAFQLWSSGLSYRFHHAGATFWVWLLSLSAMRLGFTDLLCASAVCSFLPVNSVLLYPVPTICHPFTCWWTFELLPDFGACELGCYKQSCMVFRVHTYFCNNQEWVAGLMVRVCVSLLKSCRAFFQMGCPILHSRSDTSESRCLSALGIVSLFS